MILTGLVCSPIMCLSNSCLGLQTADADDLANRYARIFDTGGSREDTRLQVSSKSAFTLLIPSADVFSKEIELRDSLSLCVAPLKAPKSEELCPLQCY